MALHTSDCMVSAAVLRPNLTKQHAHSTDGMGLSKTGLRMNTVKQGISEALPRRLLVLYGDGRLLEVVVFKMNSLPCCLPLKISPRKQFEAA